MTPPTVTVVTVTRGRPDKLREAIGSVRAQAVAVPVEHLVVVDDCSRTTAMLEAMEPGPSRWVRIGRAPDERDGLSRLARLRNESVRRTNAEWVAFLDDDNLWRSDHLATLLACARESGSRAVHCHRDLRRADGFPYLDPYFPWVSGRVEAAATYRRAVVAGVMRPGSSLLRSRVSAALPEEFRFVDMGEWLAARALFAEVPFTEEFTPEQVELGVGEDDQWLKALLDHGELISCTGEATLRYVLGGMSTAGNTW